MTKTKLLIAGLFTVGVLNINAISLQSNDSTSDDIETQVLKMQEELFKMFNMNSSSNIFSNLNTMKAKVFRTYPKMNTYNNKDYYTYEFELAGMNKKDIKIQIDKYNVLDISGEHKSYTKNQQKDLVTQERFYGKFSRKIQLNDDIDQNNIKITFNNSILKIVIQKDKAKIKNNIKLLHIQ